MDIGWQHEDDKADVTRHTGGSREVSSCLRIAVARRHSPEFPAGVSFNSTSRDRCCAGSVPFAVLV